MQTLLRHFAVPDLFQEAALLQILGKSVVDDLRCLLFDIRPLLAGNAGRLTKQFGLRLPPP